MKRTLQIILIAISIYTLAGIGCAGGKIPLVPPNQPQQNQPTQKFITYFWLAADKDAYVTSIQDWPHGGLFWDNIGTGTVNGTQRTYVHFFMPTLPAGAKILDARINLYEDSQMWPGQAGFDIGTTNDDWNPETIIWSDQPNPPGPLGTGATFGAYTTYNVWRGSTDVKNIVQQQFDNPSTNFGFVLQSHDIYGEVVRSFSSVNNLSRTSDDMGQAPRLLLKVETDTRLELSDVLATSLTPDNELSPRLPGQVLVLLMRSGTDTGWPTDWDVATQ